jgi:hypothetical protein
LNPFELLIVLPKLKDLNCAAGPVKGSVLAELNGWPERTTRYWLRRLEETGLVTRPYGKRSGYLAV